MDRSGKNLDKSGHAGGIARVPFDAKLEKTGSKAGSVYPQGVTAQCIPSHVAARDWVLTSASARHQIHLLALVRGEAIVVLPDGGRTVLLASHELDLTRKLATREVRLAAGQIRDAHPDVHAEAYA